jgi:UDP-N-acetylglucosamine pyrophosphorylase
MAKRLEERNDADENMELNELRKKIKQAFEIFLLWIEFTTMVRKYIFTFQNRR